MDATVVVDQVTLDGVAGSPSGNEGLIVIDPVASCTVTNSTIIDLETGMEFIKVKNQEGATLQSLPRSNFKTGVKLRNS